MEQLCELYHKYSFRGDVRTYKNKLTLIDTDIVKYLGKTTISTNNWNIKNKYPINLKGKFIPKNYTVDDFLNDTKQYDKPISQLIHNDLVIFKGKKKPKSVDDEAYARHGGKDNSHNQSDNKKNPLSKRTKTTDILKAGTFLCCYCETPLTKDNFTKEHIIPISRGGTNRAGNLLPCCKDCNYERGNYMLQTYIQILNLNMLNCTGDDLVKLQTKINNANKIAIGLGYGNYI